MRLNLREEKAAGFFLFLGAVLIGIALGGFLYTMTHKTPPPDMTFFPLWGIVLALALTLILVTILRDPGFRVAFLALAVGQGLMLWKLIRGPGPTLWFIDNTVSLLIGAVCVSVSAKKNGRIARIVALLLSAGMVAARYFSIENWMRALERMGHGG
jgi:ABC-type antimicrobial peptide transport system permease subunit